MKSAPAALASILVVDDTIENLRLLASILGEQGYEVRPVTNGRQALIAAERDPPDLILLDVNMPEMNGYEVCARIKERPEFADIPVVFLTAMSDIGDKLKAFAVGGFDYVTKPFKVEEVLARVRTHVAIRKGRQELTRSYDRLRELERVRDDLVHMVVHDMKSPLTVLTMGLDVLQSQARRSGAGPNVQLAACGEAVTSLNRMANDLLDVSRLEAGELPLSRTTVDLVRIAKEACTAVAGLDSTRAIDVEAAGPVEASCDAGLIRRVLDNLVLNGIKYTPSGSRLRVSIAAGEGRARVAVQDEGPGIPPDARERIFDKFATVGAPNDSHHSTGLGLAFCKLAVEAHGGTIGVGEVAPHGSLFWFELPS